MSISMDADAKTAQFETLYAERAADAGAPAARWLPDVRRAALEDFVKQGFPSNHLEAWKYTNTHRLSDTTFHRPSRTEAIAESHAVLPNLGPFSATPTTQVVFVDGYLMPRHSQRGDLPEGVQVTSLARALDQEPGLLERHLSATEHDRALTQLNTALFEDGAYVRVPAGVTVERPIHLTFVSTATQTPFVANPRVVVELGAGAAVTIIEHFSSAPNAVYWNNAVTQVELGPGARADHYKLQREGGRAFHTATSWARVPRDASFASHVITLGGALTRQEAAVHLAGRGADTILGGLYMLTGEQHADHDVFIDHAEPHVNSSQLFKGIMNGSARGVFTGSVLVRKNAQQINAQQSNKNLLLSDKALAESRPQLEIYADDVKCAHGSAIGRLDEEAIYYLRSRGIGLTESQALLTYAFAREVLDGFRVASFRQHLEELFAEWLPAGRLLGGIGHGPSRS